MQSSDDLQERDGWFDAYFDELREDPEWWAETTLARQAMAHLLTVMKEDEEELRESAFSVNTRNFGR